MKKILFFLIPFCIFNFFTISSQTKLNSGLIIEAGKGNLLNLEPSAYQPYLSINGETFFLSTQYSSTYQYFFATGYKFRIKPAGKKFFYDLDLSLGAKKIVFEYREGVYQSDNSSFITYHLKKDDDVRFYASITPTFNYKLTKGLSAGIGLAPVYYLARTPDPVCFDVPITGKLSYDWKHVGLSVSYKYGITDVLKSEKFKSGRVNDFQIQLFIPF